MKLSPRSRLYYPLAFLAGGLLPLGLAPFNLWWLSIIAVGVFPFLLGSTKGFLRGWAYGAGVFTVGVSWVYVSLSEHTTAGAIPAGAATAVLGICLGLFFGLQGYLHQLIPSRLQTSALSMVIWVLLEWIRSWLFTGFPWLYLGYTAQTTALFDNFIPIIGIYGCSFIIGLWGVLLTKFIIKTAQIKNIKKSLLESKLIVGVLVLIPALNIVLGEINWVQKTNESLTIALLQGNIAQSDKWNPQEAPKIVYQYLDMTEKAAFNNADLIIWPEAAIPYLYSESETALQETRNLITSFPQQPSLITGILTDDQPNAKPLPFSTPAQPGWPVIRNSVLLLEQQPEQDQLYHKQKLVPFGEYLPFADQLVQVFPFLEVFKHGITAGETDQLHIETHNWSFQPLICYEIAFPQLAYSESLQNNKLVDAIITVSNDGWFGLSHGPSQHFQMAQFRAMELGRPVIRATNTGITGIIEPDGYVKETLPREEKGILYATLKKSEGRTPYTYLGPYSVLGLILLVGIISLFMLSKAPRI
ncbi:MAG: apolipoprotein N-acyltransferase [Pseudomonadota bacterium]|nr:apolipoprotein N-acyltransferase [Gammaproteobacteria bacterium]MEC8012043.1 apolipoprotein N-acyltransferase [Pseudomonadota bacterium]HBF09384.1 apolipoprotein N-acyltransferase [Gammaproteobacteria bacterium]|tara:strand:+ start:37021 stop:38607 length:1587 start_codon:yes stop_codon:yes gene_type:complete